MGRFTAHGGREHPLIVEVARASHFPDALIFTDLYVPVRVNGDAERWKDRCDRLTVPARFGDEYAMPYERDRPILECVGPRQSLRNEWGDFKHYE